jgi:hypothetical protein
VIDHLVVVVVVPDKDVYQIYSCLELIVRKQKEKNVCVLLFCLFYHTTSD